jgi:hypothetical protein
MNLIEKLQDIDLYYSTEFASGIKSTYRESFGITISDNNADLKLDINLLGKRANIRHTLLSCSQFSQMILRSYGETYEKIKQQHRKYYFDNVCMDGVFTKMLPNKLNKLTHNEIIKILIEALNYSVDEYLYCKHLGPKY